MPTTPSSQDNPRGGSHEQHAKTGQQNHKNDDEQGSSTRSSSGSHGGSHEQHAKAGQQSHKNLR